MGKSKRKAILSIICSFVVILIILMLIIFALGIHLNKTLGWFSSNNTVEGNGMGVSVADNGFELKVESGNIGYTSLYDFINELFSFDRTHLNTGEVVNNKSIIWRIGDAEEDILRPGKQGELHFTIVTNNGNADDIHYSLNIQCFTADLNPTDLANGIEKVTDLHAITSESTHDDSVKIGADLLRTHLMFFTKRTGNQASDYQYSGFISDISSFTLTPERHASESNQYDATIYWIWPNTIGQILLDTTNPNDSAYLNGANSILDTNSKTYTTDREAVTHYLERGTMFYSSASNYSSDHTYYGSQVTSLYTKRNSNQSFGNEFDTLSAGYNAADLMIGLNVNYIALLLEANR